MESVKTMRSWYRIKTLDKLKALLIEEFKRANGNYFALDLFDRPQSQDLMKTNRDFMQNKSTTTTTTTATTTEGDFEEMLDTGFGNLIRALGKDRRKLIKELRTNIVAAFGDGPAPPKTVHELKTQLIKEVEKPNGIYLALKLFDVNGRDLVLGKKKLGLGLFKKQPRNEFEMFLNRFLEKLRSTPALRFGPWDPLEELRKGIIFAREPQTLDELKIQLIEKSENPDGLTLVLNLFDTPNSQRLMIENTVYHQDPLSLSPYTPPDNLERILDFNFKILLDFSHNVEFRSKWKVKFRSKWIGRLRNQIEEFMRQRYGPKSLNQLKTKLIELSKETDGLKLVLELFDGSVGSRLMKTNGGCSPDIIDGGSFF